MRLISFLSDIEQALIAESPVVDGGAWESSRIMNFQNGLARLTVKPGANADLHSPSGTIFLQSFVLADGTLCLKANLNWKDSEACPVMAVYSTPNVNWKLQASQIAGAWLEGPPAQTSVSRIEELAPLMAATG